MKTGFVHAYANKSVSKIYYYHGMIRECNIQPDPEPFIKYPLGVYSSSLWELWDDQYWDSTGTVYWNYNDNDFLPSSFDDECNVIFGDGRERYYFLNFYYKSKNPDVSYYAISDGNNCQITEEMFSGGGISLKYSGKVWHGTTYLVVLCWPDTPSRVRVWRSSDGNLPTYDPS